jgi:ABC-type glutathione transport system ATPase component
VLLLFAKGDVRMMLGVFAVASFRLLPAFRSLLGGWTQVQNASCCLDVIEEGLKEDLPAEDGADDCEVSFEDAIEMDGLSYAYPGDELILENFSCRISKGEYVGFCGTSGAGKSTLFNMVAGFIEPESGEIRIDGEVLTRRIRASWMKQIGYVPQEGFIFNGTLAENIALGCEQIDYRQIDSILKKLGLGKWVESLPDGVDTRLSEAGGKMSGGQKQRIGIARSVVMQPDMIIADEPVSALDVSIQAQVINLLNELRETLGLTILFIAHDLSVVKYFSDRIGVMYYGKMVELATSDELFAHPLHPYTRSLLSAIPLPDPRTEKERKRKVYNALASHDYSVQQPTMREVSPGHFVYCNDAEEEKYRKILSGEIAPDDAE